MRMRLRHAFWGVLAGIVAPTPAHAEVKTTASASFHAHNDGDSLVFDVVPTATDIIVFAKGVKAFPHITVHMNYGPECTHGGQKWKNLSNFGSSTVVCLFQGGSNNGQQVLPFRSHVHSITMQIYRCEHPPGDLQATYSGAPLTLEVNGIALPTSVTYAPFRHSDGPGSSALISAAPSKPYYLCSCMTMWYRTEFLLEWLRYHGLAHGVEKLFLYDNDSGLDFLADVAKMLGSMLPIERVWWPQFPTQLAYMGHCAQRAAQQCEWVTFFDIDEFVYSKKGTGRLADLLRRVEVNEPQVAALEIQMIAMSPINATTVVKKPIGGVVHNYNCRWRATNVKSVIRASLVHPSLYGGVHFFCYKEGYRKVTLLSTGNPVLYHYKHQAWEIYSRKYQRRASPASKPFDDHAGRLDTPSTKWWKETRFCKAKDYTIHFHTLCALSYRVAGPNCTARRPAAQVLVVGTGGLGSGMTWMLLALRRSVSAAVGGGPAVTATAAAGGKAVLATVDWTKAVLRPPVNNTRNPNPLRRYRRIFHLVRDPLEAIVAVTTYSEREWVIVHRLIGFDAAYYPDPLLRALHFWVIWNQLIEMTADWRFRVEDVAFVDLCARAGLHCDSNLVAGERVFARTKDAPSLTWAKLSALDPNITSIAQQQARSYGYMDSA
eukprot:m.17128 g.17128  ORF g.17128 m.17128 type:complete len:659 (+) comp5142_c0_seq1:186-2162(+)